MLKKLLNPSSCANCRVCCGFVEDDKWEIPLIFNDLREYIMQNYDTKLSKHGNEYVFDMEFKGDKLVYCPMASESGCILGDKKPFDCKIWPFRINRLDNRLVITLSPVCGEMVQLPLSELLGFLGGGFKETLFQTAKQHPDMIKPYIDGYPILAVE